MSVRCQLGVKTKAYYVYLPGDEENYSDFVKAKTSGQAKYRCWFYGDVDFIEIKTRRTSFLDDKPLTSPNILAIPSSTGFYYSCLCDAATCYNHLDGDDNTHIVGDKVLCSKHYAIYDMVFITPFIQYMVRDKQPCRIVCEIEDAAQPMFAIEFCDGVQIDAFDDEILDQNTHFNYNKGEG